VRAARALWRCAAAAVGGLADLLLPPACSVCRALLEDRRARLCPECLAEIRRPEPPLCAACGQPTHGSDRCAECRSAPPPARIRSAMFFSGAAAEALTAFKLGGRIEIGDWLVEEMEPLVRALPFDLEILVGVPLHRSRLRQRGFNQAAGLARGLGRRLHLPVSLDHLVRIRATPPQGQAAGRRAREENVRGAFAVRRRHPFAGKRVCLVDDIATTGATLSECARVLLAAGAAEVAAVTAARTPPPDA
jgi:ComF family protein